MNEAAVTRSLSFGSNNQPAVVPQSHGTAAAGCSHAIQTIDCHHPRAALIHEQQGSVNPFGFARSDLPGSQVSTPCFQSRRVSNNAPNDSLVGEPGAHYTSLHHRASIIGTILCSSNETCMEGLISKAAVTPRTFQICLGFSCKQ